MCRFTKRRIQKKKKHSSDDDEVKQEVKQEAMEEDTYQPEPMSDSPDVKSEPDSGTLLVKQLFIKYENRVGLGRCAKEKEKPKEKSDAEEISRPSDQEEIDNDQEGGQLA